MAQTVLVSGATGVIGGRLVSLLSREGADVRALTRTPERIAGRPRQGVTAVAWDGVHAPADAVRGTAAVVHLAGEPVFAGRPTRAIKASGHWYANVIRAGGLEPQELGSGVRK